MTQKKQKRRLAIIASKGSLDMAYPPLILATTASAMDMEVGIFFTFYGLEIIKKNNAEKLQVVPIGNPSIPLPNLVGALPGMAAIATSMMKASFKKEGVATISQLLELAKEGGVRLMGCQMTMDALSVKKEDVIDGVEFVGAATFLDFAAEAQISLFI